MKNILQLIRVPQWIKNIFVFIPLFFSGDLIDLEKLKLTVIGFFLFSFSASWVYVLNDYVDIEKDRLHPEKKKRPLASGALSKKDACLVGLVLAVVIMALLYWNNKPKVAILIGIYLMLNLAYTFKIKHLAILDVTIIAIGFLLRVLVGGYMTGIIISEWTIILTLMLALLMAFGKRRGEYVSMNQSGNTRKALEGYNLSFLDNALSISAALILMSYLMFCMQPNNLERYGGYLHYSIIFVLVAVFRYLQLAMVYNRVESPTKMIYKDRFLQLVLLAFVGYYFFLIYR